MTTETMTCYLSRLVLDPRSRTVHRDLANPYDMHRSLLRAFPALPKPTSFRSEMQVLYRVDHGAGLGAAVVLVQSAEEPDWSHLDTGNGYVLSAHCKPIAAALDQLGDGMPVAFRLRANVTKKTGTEAGPDGQRSNGRRIPLRTPEEQLAWLARKGESGGFALHQPRSGALPDCRALPEPDLVARRAKQRMTFASVVFEGRLEITDAAAFRETLIRGIGPAKAFGFGLLSIAPA